MSKINDFGTKIGGARKDLWKTRGIILEDVGEMSDAEKTSYIKKDNIWPKYDTAAMLSEGQDRFVVYWKNEMRKAIHPKPDVMSRVAVRNPQMVPDINEEYIKDVRMVMEMVNQVQDEKGISAFYKEALSGKILVKCGTHSYDYAGSMGGILKGNVFLKQNSPYGLLDMKRKMEKADFGLSKEDVLRRDHQVVCVDGKQAYWDTGYSSETKNCLAWANGSGKSFYYTNKDPKNQGTGYALVSKVFHNVLLFSTEENCRMALEELVENELKKQEPAKAKRASKKKWVPEYLETLERTGPVHMHGEELTGESFISSFGIRAGEYGNYVGDKERQANIDLCYDAFCDLADALGIPYENVSLPGLSLGSLAIAFGARGRGDAAAHYEPLREVINLTKIRGAGSLAHEWGHALDHFIGQKYGVTGLATEETSACIQSPVVTALKRLKETVYFKPDGGHTQYYKESAAFDHVYSKAGHGYWGSACELFARAFSVYVMSKLEEAGRKNDYLCGHSESFVSINEKGGLIRAYPVGEERIRINRAFDHLLEELKKEELLCKKKEDAA